jgi:signal transduction histidine kinase
MNYATFILILLYYFTFAIYYRKLFPMQGKRLIPFVLTFALIVTAYITLKSQNLSMLNMPVVTVIMMMGLRFITGMNLLQAVYGGLVSVLSAYCSRGVFVSLGALALGRPVLFDTAYCAFGIIGLLVSLFFFLILRKTVLSDQKLKMLLYNESQLKLVIAYGIAATVNLTLMHSGRYVSQHNVWYPAVGLATYMLTLGLLVLTIYYSIRSTELLVYRERSQILEEQYARQLGHYKSYKKYTESFYAFRHDYKAMMGTVKSLIRAGEGEQAIQIIDAVYDDVQKKVQVHKRYSNHVVLDVMLQDLANLCEENEIRYSFRVFVPHNTGLTLLDALRIFSNVTTNAVEACKKLPASERYIQITTSIEQQWAVLEVTNPFNGEITLRNGRLVTTKVETETHGLGLGIVSEIAEVLGGFVWYDTGAENRTFSIRIFIPQVGSQTAFSSEDTYPATSICDKMEVP